MEFLREESMRKARVYSREFKERCCSMVLSGGRSQAQVCREYELSPQLMTKWLRQYHADGKAGFSEPKGVPEDPVSELRPEEYEALIGRLYAENELLRSALKKGLSDLRKERN
jgi:transposase-like protein